MDEKDSFVIVFGALRSGTTLLRLMLHKHPQLSCPGEADFLFDYLSIDQDGSAEIDFEALRRDRIYKDSGVTIPSGKSSERVILEMIFQLRQQPNQRVVLMLHRGIEKALQLFPDVLIVHMLRDPRDVARSSIGMGWAGTIFHGVQHWVETEQEWDRVSRRLSNNHVETIKYEQLILSTRKELDRICRFFRIKYRDEMLDYHISSTYAQPDADLIEQWRHKQSPRELALVEGRLGTMLTLRGYSPSGHPPRKPAQAEKLSLLCRNKCAVWQTRIKRYGLLDPLLVAISRRLRIPSAGYNAQIRIDKKLRAFRK